MWIIILTIWWIIIKNNYIIKLSYIEKISKGTIRYIRFINKSSKEYILLYYFIYQYLII